MDEKTRRYALEQIDKFKDKRVLVVGDSILDEYVYGEPVGLSNETATIKFVHKKTERSYGGAANVVENLLSLGTKVSFVTLLGDDEYSIFFRNWNHENLRVFPVIESGRKTIVKRKIWGGGYNQLEIEHLDNRDLDEESEGKVIQYVKEEIDRVGSILIQDCRHGMLPKSLIDKIKVLAQEGGKKIFVNSQTTQREPNHSDYSGVFMIGLSKKEASDVDADLSNVSKKINSNFYVTEGGDGALINLNGALYREGAVSVNASDVIGAGDSFLAALSLCDVEGNPQGALYVANAWAGLSVTKPGTQTPELSELRRYIESDK